MPRMAFSCFRASCHMTKRLTEVLYTFSGQLATCHSILSFSTLSSSLSSFRARSSIPIQEAVEYDPIAEPDHQVNKLPQRRYMHPSCPMKYLLLTASRDNDIDVCGLHLYCYVKDAIKPPRKFNIGITCVWDRKNAVVIRSYIAIRAFALLRT
jgi:hypothetical protein